MRDVRRVIALGMLLLGCAGERPPDGNWEQEVRAAEERHLEAFRSRDQKALEAMLAEDFMVNSPRNRIIGKDELLKMVGAGVLAFSEFEQNIERIRRYGDVVVVMGEDRVSYIAPSPNAGQTHRRRFTDLWQRRDTVWQFVARQANIVPPQN
jgi:ketosteroid isomerase-like protein